MRAHFSACLVLFLTLLLLPSVTHAQAGPAANCAASPTPPEAILSTHPAPPFPGAAVKAGMGGTTKLLVTIGTDGAVIDATVAQSSGSAELDQSAIAWVKPRYRWKPATFHCEPVAVRTDLAIVWSNEFRAAPDPPAQGSIPASWSGEAPAGQEQSASFEIPCNIDTISATLRLSDPHFGGDVNPQVGMVLSAPSGEAQRFGPERVLLRLAGYETIKRPAIALRRDGGLEPTNEIGFPNTLAYDQDVPVTLSWTVNRQINIAVDWKKGNLGMVAVPTKAVFFVTGAKGMISKVETSWRSTRIRQPATCERRP